MERFSSLLLEGLKKLGVTLRFVYEPILMERQKISASQLQDPTFVPTPSRRKICELLRWADCIHLNGPALSFLPLALKSHKPVVITHHGLQAVCPRGDYWNQVEGGICPRYFRQRRWANCLHCLAKNNGILMSSRLFMATAIREKLLGPPSLSHVVPSQYLHRELQHLDPLIIHHGFSAPSSPPPWSKGPTMHLLFIGRLVEQKNPLFCLRVLEILKEKGQRVHLRIAGDGPLKKSMESYVLSKGLKDAVTFLDAIPKEKVEEQYLWTHFVLLPSVYAESFGFVALETILHHRPLLASPFGALPELVPPQWLLLPHDPELWSLRIIQLWEDPSSFLTRLHTLAAEYRKQFTVERMVSEYLNLYNRIQTTKT